MDRSGAQTEARGLGGAGHLTIFVARTRRHFWSDRPSLALFLAVAGTQLIATLISVYGLFMAPIGWTWALAVWGYALVWFFVNDLVKLGAYRLFGGHRDAGLMSRVRKSEVKIV